MEEQNVDQELIPIADYCTKHELALNLLFAETIIEIEQTKNKSEGSEEGSYIKHCLYFYHHAQDVIEIYEQEKIPEMVRRFQGINLN